MIEPFLVSGGETMFRIAGGYEPRPEGVELVCSLYVPQGKVAFVKQIRVAPFLPTQLADPWTTTGVAADGTSSWRDVNVGQGVAPGGTNGVWTTPFGWESYHDSTHPAPHWEWLLRFIGGDADVARRTAAFSTGDPNSWYLVENIAVPLSAYPGGIPGAAPSGYFYPQRMQVIQGDALVSHVLVPSDTTLCLFTRWSQDLVQPKAFVQGAVAVTNPSYGPTVFPLLPSFGQLHGYLQAADRVASTENAEFGWGG